MNIKKISFIGIIVIIGMLAYLSWQKMQVPDMEGIVSGNGRIEATEINIATRIPGELQELYVQEGEFVEPGQRLASIKTASLEAQLREVQAQKRQAESTVANANAMVAMRESEKAAAEAVVEQRRTELVAARNRLSRTEVLAKEGAASRQQLDDERADVKRVQAVLSASRAQVNSAESAILAAQSQALSAQSQVEAIEATIERVTVDIDDAVLVSPLRARVQFRVAEVGEMVPAGGRVMNLIDLSDVYMTFFIPETVAGRIALGTEVRIVLDAAKDVVVPATVSFVADKAQFTPKTVETEVERQKLMFRVKAKVAPELLNKYIEQVKTGLPGMAYIKIEEQKAWPPFLENIVK